MIRPTLLCVQRVAPANALAAEVSAADWITDVCPPGVYATLTTVARRTRVHQLTRRCEKLATALERLRGGGAPHAGLGHAFARSLQLAMSNDSTVRFLVADELRITVHASPDDEALHVYVQPAPPPPSPWLDAALLTRERAAAPVRDDVRRGAAGGWATPLVHPSLQPADGGPEDGGEFEETLLHEASTDRVIEGLNSNLFAVMRDGSLRTAGVGEGAYPGSVREAVLELARESRLFPAGVSERAPTAAELSAGAWREAWLTCASRRVAPLSRIWQPGAGWAGLGARALGLEMRSRLEEDMLRASEPL